MNQLFFIIAIVIHVTAGDYTFPEDFVFGVSTSAFQVEGGWDADGKGPSIWDVGLHEHPEYIPDGTQADVACDSYHKYKEDVQMLKTLGVDFYRFSISWPRVLPDGHAENINPAGLQYYNNLIDELLANGIQPYVTMFHWDLPQALHEEVGGWLDRRMIDLFVDYARVLFENYGDRVKWWMTFNEISQICERGYSDGRFAPFISNPGIGGYECSHIVLLAHGRTYRMYNEEFRATQNGSVGISINTYWHEPNYADRATDQAAAEFSMQMNYGWFVHPFILGNYPQPMIDRIKNVSQAEGFPKSRLPEFTEDEILMLNGTYDFLGLNHYQTDKCYWALEDDFDHPSHAADVFVIGRQESDYWKGTPWGLHKLLIWIRDNYGNPPVLITENGHAQDEIEDWDRINYHRNYLNETLNAIYEDDCNVIGYTAWSLMDNFEWRGGFTIRMGLYFVDFEDPNRARSPKMSSLVYNNIIETRHIDYDYVPPWPSTEK